MATPKTVREAAAQALDDTMAVTGEATLSELQDNPAATVALMNYFCVTTIFADPLARALRDEHVLGDGINPWSAAHAILNTLGADPGGESVKLRPLDSPGQALATALRDWLGAYSDDDPVVEDALIKAAKDWLDDD